MQQTMVLMTPILQQLSRNKNIWKILRCERYPRSHFFMIRHWSPARMLVIQICTTKINLTLHDFCKKEMNWNHKSNNHFNGNLTTPRSLNKLDFLPLHIKPHEKRSKLLSGWHGLPGGLSLRLSKARRFSGRIRSMPRRPSFASLRSFCSPKGPQALGL